MAMLFRCLIVVFCITIQRIFPVKPVLQSEFIKERNVVIEILNRSELVEINLAKIGGIEEGSRTYESMLVSWADNKALSLAKEAYIQTRTLQHLFNKYCLGHRVDDKKCFDDLTKHFVSNDVSKITCKHDKYRSVDGSCNNKLYPYWGKAYGAYSRVLPSHYLDNIWFEFFKRDYYNNKDFIDPLKLSEILAKDLHTRDQPITVAAIAWSNLVAYDMSHTASYRAFFTKQNINCCDKHKYRLAPRHRHQLCSYMNNPDDICVSYVRSMLAVPDNHQPDSAQQMNTASNFLDGSIIYGNTEQIEDCMRAKAEGQLKVLPNNEVIDKKINCVLDNTCFFTADLRSILNPASAAIQTMLVREHNRIAESLQKLNPKWNDEKLFYETKRIVVAEIQHITYNEWLPLVIGKDMIDQNPHLKIEKEGHSTIYNKNVNPTVSNEFANAAMKFVTPLNLAYLNSQNPYQIKTKNHLKNGPIDINKFQNIIEDMGKSLIAGYSSKGVKSFNIEDKEGDIESLGLDIERGRDHGFPPYIDYLEQSDSIPVELLGKIKKLSRTACSIDLVVGGLAEKPRNGTLVGKTFKKIIAEQMEATRLGDRYFYDNKLQPYPFTYLQINEIKKVRLARLLCDNFSLVEEVQMSSMLDAKMNRNKLVKCSDEIALSHINLKLWKQ